MLDASVGTIDYADETLEDAVEEVRSFFHKGNPLLDYSFTVEVDGKLGSAALVAIQNNEPFIGYVMTRRYLKRTGLARLVTATSLRALAEAGFSRVIF